MDFKKKWQRFWTLDRHHDGGFTLVELITVIAIMAILAGVAVPAYNGYIAKSYEAADMQLLAAVSTAFASACMEDSIDVKDVQVAEFSLKDQQINKLETVQLKDASEASLAFFVLKANAAEEAKTPDMEVIRDAFMRYYLEANGNAKFKTVGVKSICWDPNSMSFVLETTSVTIHVNLSNGEVTIDGETVDTIDGSFIGSLDSASLDAMFGGIQDGATATLVGKVDDMAEDLHWTLKTAYGLLSELLGDTGKNQLGAWLALQSTGLKNNTDIFGDRYDEINKTLGSLTASKADKEAAMNEFSNAMLLYTADILHDQNPTTIQNKVKESYFDTDTNLVSTGGNGAMVVSAAIRESLYQAYLQTDDGKAAVSKGSDKDTITGSTEFKNYLESPQCGNDIAGLVATMGVIQENKDDIGISELVQQGMGNVDASTLFGEIIG